MNKPKPTTRCRACKKRYENHPDKKCPDGSGREFISRSLKRSSTSFSEREVAWLDEVLRGLMRGAGSMQTLVRAPECKAIAAKLQAMKTGIERNKQNIAQLAEAK